MQWWIWLRAPVTVKTRLGWDDASIDIVNVARMLEDCGIQALAVHARTRKQMYSGTARWSYLHNIKSKGLRQIPLIGNGDALKPQAIRRMFEETGVDGVMIGRGAIGNPWIFERAKTFLSTGEVPPPPSWEERIMVVVEHLTLKCEWLGESRGVKEMRRMYGGYFKGFRNASRLRARLMKAYTQQEVLDVLFSTMQDNQMTIVLPGVPYASLTSCQSSQGHDPEGSSHPQNRQGVAAATYPE